MDPLLKENLITTKDASELSGYTSDYLARLVRSGEITGKKIGHSWLVNTASLEIFLDTQKSFKSERARELASSRVKEYRLRHELTERASRDLTKKIPVASKMEHPVSETGLTHVSLRSHLLALSSAFAVVIMGANLASAEVLPNFAGHVASIAEEVSSGFNETFGDLPSHFTSKINAIHEAMQENVSRVATANEEVTSNLASPLLSDPDISSLQMALGENTGNENTRTRVATSLGGPASKLVAARGITHEDVQTFADDAFRFVTSPAQVVSTLAHTYVAIGYDTYALINSSLTSYRSLIEQSGERMLALAATTRDTLATAPRLVSKMNLAFGNAIIDATHMAIRAEVTLAYSPGVVAPAAARTSVALMSTMGDVLMRGTIAIPNIAKMAFLRATEAPAELAPALAEAVFGAEYAGASRFVALTTRVTDRYALTLRSLGEAGYTGAVGTRSLANATRSFIAHAPIAIEDAYLGALGKTAVALDTITHTSPVAAVFVAATPAFSEGEKIALATYLGIHRVFESMTSALAVLFTPSPLAVVPTRVTLVATSSPVRATTLVQQTVNSYPTYTTIVQGVSPELMNQSLAALRLDVLSAITANTVSGVVRRFSDARSGGVFNGGIFDGGSMTNGISVTATNGTFTNLSGGTTNLATTTITGDLTVSGTMAANIVSVTDHIKAPYFVATSTTATSTFAGSLNIDNGGFVYATSTRNVGIGVLSPAALLAIQNSTSTQPIFVASNDVGTEVYRITNNGFVGIGTTTPGYALAVEGSSSLGNQAIAGYFTATTTTATSTFAGSLAVGTTSPWGNGLFTVGTSSPMLHIDNNSGNVGINGLASNYRLDINGTVRSVGDVFFNANTTLGSSTTTDVTYVNSRIAGHLVPTVDNVSDIGDGTAWLRWRTGYFGTSVGINGTATSTGASLLASGAYLIDSASPLSINTTHNQNVLFGTGNIGLGVAVPTYTLDVAGYAHFTSYVDASHFVATSTTATSTFMGGFTAGNNVALTINQTSPANSLYVTTSGDVGINTSVPLYKLDVNGTFRTVGATFLNANTTIGGTLAQTGLATFTSGFLANASSTITSGLFSMNGGASTTNITASGIGYFGNSIDINGTATSTGVSLLASGPYLIDSASPLSLNTTHNQNVLFGTGNVLLPFASSTALTLANAMWIGGNATTTSNGNFTTNGNIVVNGSATLGDATSTDITYFNSRIAGHLVPTIDNVSDLGDGTAWLRWRTGYFGNSIGIAGTATSTGISLLASGAYLIDSASPLSLNTAHNQNVLFGTGNVTFPNASTTNFSIASNLWVGGNATTTANGNFSTNGMLSIGGTLTQSGLATFTNGFLSNASSTITTGLFSMNGGASTTNITASGIGYFGTEVNAPSFVGALTGNASTATALQNTRAINGVAFNGTADITVPAHAGIDSYNAITANIDGTANVPANTATFLNDAGTAFTEKVITASTTLALTDGAANYVVADRDTGTWAVLASADAINYLRYLPYAEIYRSGDNLHVQVSPLYGYLQESKNFQRISNTERYARESGFDAISVDASLKITANGGVAWAAFTPFTIAAVTAATTWFDSHHESSAWVNTYYAANPVINNTQYDPGTNLATLTDGYWTINYLYRGIEADAQNHLYRVLGNAQFASLELAKASNSLSSLPVLISSHAMLIGRVIVQKGTNSNYTIESAFSTVFAGSSAVTSHASLTGLELDDHTQYALLAGRAGGQTLMGGTNITDILKLQGTAGIGTATSPAIQALVGTNGGTTALTILNNGYIGIGTTTPAVTFDIYATDAMRLPVGSTLQRPSGDTGYIRYNVTTHQFEGYGDNSVWQGLGGVINAAQTTYITAGTDDFLRFVTASTEHMTIGSNGYIGVGTTTPFARFSLAGASGAGATLFAISTSTAGFATTTALTIDQNGDLSLLNGSNLSVAGTGVFDGAITANAGIVSAGPISFTGTNHAGLTINNLTDTQRGALTPASGMTIFNTTVSKMQVYNGSEWKNVGNPEIGAEVTGGTAGSVLFVDASGNLAQDNANFFWNQTSRWLGLGTTTPASALDIANGKSGISIWAATSTLYKKANIGYSDAIVNDVFTISTNAPIGGTYQDIQIVPNGGGSTNNGLYMNTSGQSAFGYTTFADTSIGNALLVNGRVGIGTTSPSAKLSIKGDGTTTGRAFVISNSGDVEKLTVLDNGNVSIGTATSNPGSYAAGYTQLTLGTPTGSRGTIINLVGNGVTNANEFGDINAFSDSTLVSQISFARDSANDAAALLFLTRATGGANTERMRITSTGNVGIGTTSPWGKLAVENTGTGNSFLVGDSANDSTPFVIDNAGNVGIGTTGPIGKLQLQSANASNVAVSDLVQMRYFDGASAYYGSSAFHYHDSSQNMDKYVIGVSGTGGTTAAPNTIAQAKMVIQANGRVGIGTTSPWKALSVVGGVAFPDLETNTDNASYQVVIKKTNGVLMTDNGLTVNPAEDSVIAGGVLLSGATVRSNAAVNLILATPTFNPGIVLTNNTSRVGIGTTTPGSKLSVAGSASIGVNYGVAAPTNGLIIEGNVGIGTTSPYAKFSVGGDVVIGAATAGGTMGNLTLSALATPAGTFLAADANGKIIATTSPISSIFADYPFTGNGTSGSHLTLAFGTTTPNTWSGLQTFAGGINVPSGVLGYSMEGNLLAYASSTNMDTIFGLGAGGQNATTSATAGYNTAIGYQALNANTTGQYNTANGSNALYSNTTGYSNTANGFQSLYSNTTGAYNTANGMQALYANTTGTNNTTNGVSALYANTTGSYNIANGVQALYSNTAGSYNSVFGYNAGYNVTTGYDNIMLGHIENTGGNNITTGFNNILLGYNTVGTTTSSSNFLNIGNSFFGLMVATSSATSLPSSFANVAFAIATSTFTGNTLTVQNASTLNNVVSFYSNAGASLFGINDSGNVGIASTTPFGRLSVDTSGLAASVPSFVVGSSARTDLIVTQSGNVGIATTSPGYALDVAGSSAFGTGAEAMRIDSTGYVGIGTSTPYAPLSLLANTTSLIDLFAIATSTSGIVFKVNSYGQTFGDGAYTSPAADYAEYFYTKSTNLKSGEVVCVDVLENNAVKRCERGADNNVMGIVSTKPSVIGNNIAAATTDPTHYAIIGMMGQVEAYVSAENGPINVGDSLTSASSTPGVAMRADSSDSTVGIALEPLATGSGQIKVLISRRNKSLAVEEVEALVVDRIANMKIEDTVQQLVKKATDNIVLTKLVVSGNVFASSFETATTSVTGFTFGSTTVMAEIPSAVLTADGAGVDLYKLATYNLSGIEALLAKFDAQDVRITALETRMTALESGAVSSASGSPLSLGTTSLASAFEGLGAYISKGFAQFGTLIADKFVAATNSAGTSSAGTVSMLTGNTVAEVKNVYVTPATKIFVTFNSQITGSWWVSDKTDGSFRVVLSGPQTADVSFDYFLVQTEGQVATSTPDSIQGSTSDTNAQDQTLNTNTPPIVISSPNDTASSTPPTPPEPVATTTPPVSSDTVAPVVTLNGSAAMSLTVGDTFTDVGATATDAVDGDLTTKIVKTGTVDIATAGSYSLTYSATDAAGNIGSAGRLVTVTAAAPAAAAADTTASSTPAT